MKKRAAVMATLAVIAVAVIAVAVTAAPSVLIYRPVDTCR